MQSHADAEQLVVHCLIDHTDKVNKGFQRSMYAQYAVSPKQGTEPEENTLQIQSTRGDEMITLCEERLEQSILFNSLALPPQNSTCEK